MKHLCLFNLRTTVRLMVATALLLFAAAIFSLTLYRPVQAQQGGATPASPSQDDANKPPMMGAVTGTASMEAMSMAEMGAMMDGMMAKMNEMMASMPMTGGMPMMDGMQGGMANGMSMQEMGQMMQMMGMMHQKMGQMQMMMGSMMAGDMMGAKMMGDAMMKDGMMKCEMMKDGMMKCGMMGEGGMGGGMGNGGMGNATPEPQASVTPTATVDHSAHNAGNDAAENEAEDQAEEPAEGATPAATVDHSGHVAPAMVAAAQTATGGAVTVEATPLTTDDVLDVAFAIKLETHSVELDFNLAERATLTIGDATFAATSWEPDAPDGHHVTGVLRFTIDHPAHASLFDVDQLTLELHDIDGAHVTLNFPLAK